MALGDVFDALPPTMRDQVEGYTRFVESVSDELFLQNDIERPTTEQRETLLTLATAWKLWRAVDSQFWLLVNSLGLLRQGGITEIAVGGSRYSRESEQFRILETLRNELEEALVRLDLAPLTRMTNLSGVMEFTLESSR